MENKLQNQFFSLYSTILSKQQPIVVGVSGGPDSMFLLYTINEYFSHKGWNPNLISIAHFNHGQRKESKKEYEFLKKYSPYNTFYRNKKTPSKGLSETKLRTLRHEFFTEVMVDTGSTYLLLGHNLSDRIETTLLNINRGCGIEGFLSIKQKSQTTGYTIFRPLLGLSKTDIEKLCKQEKIPYFIDKTNKKESTPRNILRNKIIPGIQDLHSGGKEKWYTSRQQIYANIDSQTPKNKTSIVRKHHQPHQFWGAKKWLSANKNNITPQDWYELFSPTYYISTKKISLIQEFILQGSGHMFMGGRYIFVVGDTVHCIDGEKDFRKKKHSKKHTIKAYGKQKIDGYTYSIPKEYIGAIIRYPKEGDEFKKKRLLKYMINQKIPVFMRNTIPVIVKKNTILSLLRPQN